MNFCDGDDGSSVADAPAPLNDDIIWSMASQAVTTTQQTLNPKYNETLPKCVAQGKWFKFNLPCRADTPGPDSPDASGRRDTAAMLDST